MRCQVQSCGNVFTVTKHINTSQSSADMWSLIWRGTLTPAVFAARTTRLNYPWRFTWQEITGSNINNSFDIQECTIGFPLNNYCSPELLSRHIVILSNSFYVCILMVVLFRAGPDDHWHHGEGCRRCWSLEMPHVQCVKQTKGQNKKPCGNSFRGPADMPCL